eukprot:4195334-Prymnesium_polylepis.1
MGSGMVSGPHQGMGSGVASAWPCSMLCKTGGGRAPLGSQVASIRRPHAAGRGRRRTHQLMREEAVSIAALRRVREYPNALEHGARARSRCGRRVQRQ